MSERFEVTFTAPDPACGHETSWRASMWWDSESATYKNANDVTACLCAPVSADHRPAGVAGHPNRFQGLTEPRMEKS